MLIEREHRLKSIYTGIQFQLHKSELPAEGDETASYRAGMDREKVPHISHQQKMLPPMLAWRYISLLFFFGKIQ